MLLRNASDRRALKMMVMMTKKMKMKTETKTKVNPHNTKPIIYLWVIPA
jgi:hypothetical protein